MFCIKHVLSVHLPADVCNTCGCFVTLQLLRDDAFVIGLANADPRDHAIRSVAADPKR